MTKRCPAEFPKAWQELERGLRGHCGGCSAYWHRWFRLCSNRATVVIILAEGEARETQMLAGATERARGVLRGSARLGASQRISEWPGRARRRPAQSAV